MAADGFKKSIAIVFGHLEKHVLPPRLTEALRENGCFRIMLSARAV
ncbi:hypothetical protein QWJ07_21665 [Frankia sp. RB7]|nr:hypothetical protein [Frankia sp. RB7]